MSGGRLDDLAVAWQRLGQGGELLSLLENTLGWEGWRCVGGYFRGPCPSGMGKCKGQHSDAFCYPRDDGTPPQVVCNHKNSCGFSSSLFDCLAERLGSRREVAALIKRKALMAVPAADWPRVEPLIVRSKAARSTSATSTTTRRPTA